MQISDHARHEMKIWAPMKLISIVLFLCLILHVAVAEGTEDKQGAGMKPWFTSTECTGVEIKNAKTGRSLRISDSEAIMNLMRRIESISPNGGEMISMLVATHVDLVFDCGSAHSTIQILNGRFKTPTTGFNSDENDVETERELGSDIDALLEPGLNKRTLKIKYLELSIGNFSVTYTGTEERKPEANAPTVGTIHTQHFEIKDKSGKQQALRISSGQITPQPVEFSVNGSRLKLLTYADGHGARLYPDYFILEE